MQQNGDFLDEAGGDNFIMVFIEEFEQARNVAAIEYGEIRPCF